MVVSETDRTVKNSGPGERRKSARCTEVPGTTYQFRFIGPILLLVTALVLFGCVSYQSADGVENTWRELDPDQLQRGKTTKTEILEWLGPPSQMISLGDQSVFYYLTQVTRGSARIYILWNTSEEHTNYDRAVFFFDAAGILTEYSISEPAPDQ